MRDNEAASSTAFDFLGRGHAQAVYSDWDSIYAFDGKSGVVELKLPNWSPGTLLRYPVVADVDNDGSADIIVVSSRLEGELVTGSKAATSGRAHRAGVPGQGPALGVRAPYLEPARVSRNQRS